MLKIATFDACYARKFISPAIDGDGLQFTGNKMRLALHNVGVFLSLSRLDFGGVNSEQLQSYL